MGIRNDEWWHYLREILSLHSSICRSSACWLRMPKLPVTTWPILILNGDSMSLDHQLTSQTEIINSIRPYYQSKCVLIDTYMNLLSLISIHHHHVQCWFSSTLPFPLSHTKKQTWYSDTWIAFMKDLGYLTHSASGIRMKKSALVGSTVAGQSIKNRIPKKNYHYQARSACQKKDRRINLWKQHPSEKRCVLLKKGSFHVHLHIV